MNKYVDPEKLKNEIAKAPVWTSLTIIEMIDKMTESQTCEKCEYAWWNSEAKRYECSIEKCPYNKLKDEPTTQIKTQNSNLTFEKTDEQQTCSTCRFDHENWFEAECDSCCDAHSNWQPKDEPQTDCAWKKGE